NSAGTHRLYYAVRFDRPFTRSGTWDARGLAASSETSRGQPAGAYLVFDATRDRVVQMKVGLSYVTAANAQLNLEREVPRWDLAAVRKRTAAAWDDLLGRVQVSGATADQTRMLTTALYHSFLHP